MPARHDICCWADLYWEILSKLVFQLKSQTQLKTGKQALTSWNSELFAQSWDYLNQMQLPICCPDEHAITTAPVLLTETDWSCRSMRGPTHRLHISYHMTRLLVTKIDWRCRSLRGPKHLLPWCASYHISTLLGHKDYLKMQVNKGPYYCSPWKASLLSSLL